MGKRAAQAALLLRARLLVVSPCAGLSLLRRHFLRGDFPCCQGPVLGQSGVATEWVANRGLSPPALEVTWGVACRQSSFGRVGGDGVDTGIPDMSWARKVDGACIAHQDVGEGPVTLVAARAWVSHLEVYWEQPRYARFLRRLSRDSKACRAAGGCTPSSPPPSET